MVIRPYARVDAEAWVRGLNRVRPRPIDVPEFEERDARRSDEDWRRRLTAVEDGRTVAIGEASSSPYLPSDHAMVVVVVEPEERLRGRGSRMLDALAEAASRAGRPSLAAEVGEDDQAAIGWLTRRGFRRHARRFQSILELRRFRWAQHARALAEAAAEGVSFASMRGATEEDWRRLFDLFSSLLSETPDMEGLPP